MVSGITSNGKVVDNLVVAGILYTSQEQLCKQYGIAIKTFRNRRRSGMSIEDAIKGGRVKKIMNYESSISS